MNRLTTKIKESEVILGLTFSLILMWGGFFLIYQPSDEIEKTAQEQKALAVLEDRERLRSQFFDNLELEAKAYVVYNADTGEIIASHNEQSVLPLASITKVMTVLAVSDQLDPEAKIKIGEVNPENSSGLRAGESWKLKNLASLTLVSSSNEGAQILAQAATTSPALLIEEMNKKAKSLGLSSLHFTNSTGLDNGPEPGGLGSALDVAKLFAYVTKTKPELLEATKLSSVTEKSLDNFNHAVINTNKIVDQIPGLIASKTGYTDLAGGNLSIVANIGLRRPLVFVVLGSSQEGRFSDTKKLVSAVTNYYVNLNK